MVAIVSGNGLGLFNTSLTNLGFGLGGSSTFGSARTNQYVNIATGNLMLQDRDEILTFRGMDTSFLRTYNSRGAVGTGAWGDTGQDGFVTGFESRVEFGTGTPGASGTTVTLRRGDGQTTTFTWTSLNTYTATDGNGANDTLVWSSNRTWTFTEGSTRREELYADHVGSTAGRLTRIRNLLSDGTPNQFDVLYDGNNRVSEVRSIDGTGASADALKFLYYASGSIQTIQTREGGTLKTQVSYGYENINGVAGTGRLAWVEQDLTPGTDEANSAPGSGAQNGLRFRTDYTYWSTTLSDLRIASVTQSDGTKCAYTYDEVNGGRVLSVTLGTGVDAETVTFNYAPTGRTNTTKVTDTLGRIWYYKYDAKQRLIEVEAPPVDGQTDTTYYSYYNYDSTVAGSILSKDGQLTQVLTKRGSTVVSQTDYEYDTYGNVTWEWQRLGTGANTSATAIQRGYTGIHQLSWERRYSDVDTDGAVGGSLSGYQPSTTGSEYTQWIRDSVGRVHFVRNPAGEITEYLYGATGTNGVGQVASERRFVGSNYTGTLNESSLITWAGQAAQLGASTLVTYAYDARGRLNSKTEYVNVDATTGAGVAGDAGVATTTYAYDAQGLLLQQVRVHGANTANHEMVSYTYDGLGRLLSVVQRNASSATDANSIATTYSYLDTARQIVVTLDTGATRTTTFDTAHRQLSMTEAGTGITTRSSYNYYDTAGQLRCTQDTTGARTYFFYDAKGLLAGQVDPTGAMIEYVRDGMGRIIDTVGYTGRVTTTGWLDANSEVVPTSIAAVRPGWSTTFDAAISGLNTTTWVDNGSYPSVITSSNNSLAFTQKNYTSIIAPNIASNTTHTLAEQPSWRGEVTTGANQANTWLIFAVQNTGVGSNSQRAGAFFRNGSLFLNTIVDGVSTTSPALATLANSTTYVVEARARDGAVEFCVYVKGQDPATGWTFSTAADTEKWAASRLVVSSAAMSTLQDGNALYLDNLSETTWAARHAYRSYDLMGRLATETDAAGTVTTHTYDGLDNRIRTDVSAAGATTRTERYFYDIVGRQTGTLDAEGYLTENLYDFGGRLTKTIRYSTVSPNGTGQWTTGTLAQLRPAANPTNDQTTRYFYDGRNNLTGVLDAQGTLTVNTYDEAANQRSTTVYAKILTGLTGSETLITLQGKALETPAPTEPSRTTLRAYNALGQLWREVNHESTYTHYNYDEAGRLVETQHAAYLAGVTRSDFRRYDALGNLIGEMSGEQVLASGITLTTAESDLGNLYLNFGTTHTNDETGRRIESRDALGNKTWYFYDDAGHQTFVIRGVNGNTQGEVSETRYGAFGEVLDSIAYTGRIAIPATRDDLKTTLAALPLIAGIDTRRSFTYNTRGLLASSTDATGVVSRFTYNAFGQLLREYRATGTTAARRLDYTYNNRGLQTGVSDGVGAGPRSTSCTYDAFGRVVTATDARGIVTSFTYDRVGRQLSASRTVATYGGNRVESSSTTYDAFGRVLSVTDAMGGVTSYAYSDVSRYVIVTTPEGTTVKTERNRLGETVKVTDGANGISTFAFNADGKLIRSTDQIGRITEYAYDQLARLKDTTNPAGERVTLTYDAVHRVLTRVVDADGLALTTTYAYDGQGRQLTVTDPTGRAASYTYDAEGRLTQVAQDPAGLNLRTTYAYDAVGHQVTVVEGAGTTAARTVQYTYDVLGRRTTEVVDPAGLSLTTNYMYDANDNVIRRVDARGMVSRFVYDEANRVVFTIDPLLGVNRNYYDADGRLVATRRYASAITLTTDDITTLHTATGVAGAALISGKVGLGNDARDAIAFRVYDANGQLRFTVDAVGAVVESIYDGAGRPVEVRRYASPIALASLRDKLLAKHVAGQSNFANTESEEHLDGLVTLNALTDRQTRQVYDVAGQLRYVLTRNSASTYTVVQYTYDQAGRRVEEYAYGVTIADTVAMTTTGVATAVTSAGGNAASAQRLTRYVYDGAGRLRFTIDDAGAVSERLYDAAGRVIEERSYTTAIPTATAATEDAVLAALEAARQALWSTDLASWPAAGLTTTDVNNSLYGNTLTYSNGRLAFTPANATPAFPSVTRTATHDSSEEVVYTAELTTGASVASTWLLFSIENGLAGSDYRRGGLQISNGNVLSYALDGTTAVSTQVGTVAANTTYVIEARTRDDGVDYYLYVKGTDREQGIKYSVARGDHWDAIKLRMYGYARTGTDGNPLYVDNLSEAANASRHSRTRYDAAGRVIAVTDALGNTEAYGYDAVGNRTSKTDALGNLWTYDYDAAGRLTDEHSPSVTVLSFGAGGAITATPQSLVTHYTYDNLGNVLTRTEAYNSAAARITTYTYDALGRQTKTTFPIAGVYDPATQSFTTPGTAPYSLVTYDTLGNAVVNRDTLGNYSYKAYDVDGSLRYDVDALGYLTAYDYDVFGQKTSLTRYASAITVPSPGNAVTVAQIDAMNLSTTDARTIQTVYDHRGLRTEVIEPSVAYTRANGTADIASPRTKYEYDAYGNLVKERVLLEQDLTIPSETWADTYHYYDELGRKVMSVDALGYVSTWTYDALGQVKSTTEYARAIGTSTLTTTTKPGLPVMGDATIGYDRTVNYTYDAMGRKATETSERQFQTAFGGTGVRNVTTAIEYDALGHATATVADGQRTQTQYDAMGRVINVTEAARQVLVSNWLTQLDNAALDLGSAALYATVSPYTQIEYDAFGNAVRTTRYAYGSVNGAAPVVSGNDQVSINRYDWQGRLTMERDALGNERYREYDGADHVTKVWYRQSTGSGNRWRISALYTYDKNGQQTDTLQQRQTEVTDGVLGALITDQVERVVYNAFGEITDKGNAADAGTLVLDRTELLIDFQHDTYDAAGRHLTSNATGVVVSTQYNLAGQLLRESRPVYTSGTTIATATTVYTLDKLGRTTSLASNVTRGIVDGTGYLQRKYDRWGSVIEQIDARGYATNYEYNDRNQCTREIQAMVRVVDEHGVASWTRPELRTFYDATGNQIGAQDANGNIRRIEFDAAGRQVRQFDAFGSAQRFAYDALGRQLVHQNALGYLAYSTYDKGDHVLSQGDYQSVSGGTTRTHAWRQAYEYDSAGNRTKVTTSLNATQSGVQKFDYDGRGLMLRSESATGVLADYGYDDQGRKVREGNNLSIAGSPAWTDEGVTGHQNEQIWKYDYFGHLTDHNDLSGRDYTYDYLGGVLKHESNAFELEPVQVELGPWQAVLGEDFYTGVNVETAHLDRSYEYYASGQTKKITDTSGWYLYEYDANGNRTMEESYAIDGRGAYVHVRTRIEYDSHNRVSHVTTYNLDTGKYEIDLTYSYDAMGNRRSVVANSGYSTWGENVLGGSTNYTTTGVTVPEADIVVTSPTLAPRVFKTATAQSFQLRAGDLFQDPEGRVPAFSWAAAPGSTIPGWLTVTFDAPTGMYTFAASNLSGAGQSCTIELKATDINNHTVSTFQTITVADNTGPTVLTTTTPTLKVTTGQSLNLSLLAADYFRDADVGDRLTLSVDNPVPSWMTIDTSDGDAVRITGIPTAGAHTVTLRATDKLGLTVTKTITVQGVANVAPVGLTSATQFIAADKPMVVDTPLSTLFTDLDALAVTAKMLDGTQLPSWLQFQYEPGPGARVRLSGNVPAGLAIGTQFKVVLTAVDPSGLSATTTITLEVGQAASETVGGWARNVQVNGQYTLEPGATIQLPADLFTQNGVVMPYDLRIAVWVDPTTTTGNDPQSPILTPTEFLDQPHWEYRSLPDTMLWDPIAHTITASEDVRNCNVRVVVAVDETGFGTYALGNATNFYNRWQDFTLRVASGSTATPANRQEYWYTYDAENRVQVVNGRRIDGQILLRTEDSWDDEFQSGDNRDLELNERLDPSYLLSYDAAGNAVGRVSYNVDGDAVIEQSVYTQRGELAATYGARDLTNFSGNALNAAGGVTMSATYDNAGRMLSQSYYHNPDEPDPTPTSSAQSRQDFIYDLDGRMTSQKEWGFAAGQTGQGLTNLAETTQSYDELGRLDHRVYNHYAWGWRAPSEEPQAPDLFTHTFDYAYEARDSYLEKSVTGESTTEFYRATTSTSTYDAMGRRIAVKDHTALPEDMGEAIDYIRFFAYDAGAGILVRREGQLDAEGDLHDGDSDYAKKRDAHHYTYVNGQSVAHITEAGVIDVTSRLTAFDTQSGSSTSTVQEGDTLRSIAQRVYGNSGLWYVLAEANALHGDEDLAAGMTLRTPAVKTVANTDKTYAPYDPSQVIGPTTPNLPWIAPPPKAECDPVMMIIIIAVAVIATIATCGAALAAFGFASLGAAPLGVAMLAGAAGGMAGSIASQTTGMMLGVQDKFSFRSVIAGGITGAIGGGIASALGGGATAASQAVSNAASTSTTGTAMATASASGTSAGTAAATATANSFSFVKTAISAVGNALGSYVGNKIAGIEGTSFSWRSIAASAVSSFASAGFDAATGSWQTSTIGSQIVKGFVGNMVGSVVSLHVRRGLGFDDDVDYGAMAADAFGNALGSAIGSMLGARAQSADAAKTGVSDVYLEPIPEKGVDSQNVVDLKSAAGSKATFEKPAYVTNVGAAIGEDVARKLVGGDIYTFALAKAAPDQYVKVLPEVYAEHPTARAFHYQPLEWIATGYDQMTVYRIGDQYGIDHKDYNVRLAPTAREIADNPMLYFGPQYHYDLNTIHTIRDLVMESDKKKGQAQYYRALAASNPGRGHAAFERMRQERLREEDMRERAHRPISITEGFDPARGNGNYKDIKSRVGITPRANLWDWNSNEMAFSDEALIPIGKNGVISFGAVGQCGASADFRSDMVWDHTGSSPNNPDGIVQAKAYAACQMDWATMDSGDTPVGNLFVQLRTPVALRAELNPGIGTDGRPHLKVKGGITGQGSVVGLRWDINSRPIELGWFEIQSSNQSEAQLITAGFQLGFKSEMDDNGVLRIKENAGLGYGWAGFWSRTDASIRPSAAMPEQVRQYWWMLGQ